MSKHCQLLLLLFLGCQVHPIAQYYFYNEQYYNSRLLVDVGISISAFNCLTDLGGKEGLGSSFLKDLNMNETHPGVGLYSNILVDQMVGLRSEVTFGTVSASDHVLKDDDSEARNRFYRNLHFKSNILEISLLAETYPLAIFFKRPHPLLSPYFLIGIGLYKFNPKATYRGKWTELQPLRTEGQGFKSLNSPPVYSCTQLNVPLGLGVRYEISALLNARLEVVYRLLRTDYLDDVSTHYIDPGHFLANLDSEKAQSAIALADRSNELIAGFFHPAGGTRGNPEKKDSFFSCNLKLGFTLNRKRR